MSETDLQLLARYGRHQAEDAFAEIVRRHLNLVYSAALRQVRSPQLAQEVAQCVFIKLARQASRLASDSVLSAWLYQVTRREAVDVVRREARRQLREQVATEMNAMNATSEDWTHVEPLLDEAMHALDDTDRTAVLLRDVFDTRYGIGPYGFGSTDFLSHELASTMDPVWDAFKTAHNGNWPEDVSELKPYVTTPEQQLALDKLILKNSGK